MTSLEVRSLQSRSERQAFLQLPWQIYAGDSAWCPPLLADEKRFIDRKRHPFFGHGSAEFFAAYRSGKMVGRLAVSEDPRSNQVNRENVACIGLFECLDDKEAARSLFDAAANWARTRGLDRLRGPVDYSTNYPVGLLLDNFDLPQRVQMKHNPPYYQELMESYGFVKAKDLLSWWGQNHEKINRWRLKVERLAALHSTVTIRTFDVSRRQADLALIKSFALKIIESNWAYVPMTDREYSAFVKKMQMVPPELILIAEDKGDCVGLAMTVPDYNEALRPLNGRLTRWGLPLGLWKFWRGTKRITSARMALIGVKEEYRFEGIAERMILKTFDYGHKVLGYTGAELGWTFEDNEAMIQSIDRISGDRKRRFRIYEKII